MPALIVNSFKYSLLNFLQFSTLEASIVTVLMAIIDFSRNTDDRGQSYI